MIRELFPKKIRVRIKLILRLIKDIKNGHFFSFAGTKIDSEDAPYHIEVIQELKPNPAKLKNLKIAIEKIEAITIYPNQIFSFWKIVGNPNMKNGFVESRSIVNNKIENSVGGGLCQLSGLVYYISLKANLEILERHNHSVDIYTSETRFAPLGSDATLVFGYKDLRVRNSLTSKIRFSFELDQNSIKIQLNSTNELVERDITFETKNMSESEIEVSTYSNNEEIDRSIYKTANV